MHELVVELVRAIFEAIGQAILDGTRDWRPAYQWAVMFILLSIFFLALALIVLVESAFQGQPPAGLLRFCGTAAAVFGLASVACGWYGWRSGDHAATGRGRPR